MNIVGKLSIIVALMLVLTQLPARPADALAASPPKVVKVAAGSFFSLALWSDGTVSGWGSNTYGQVGNGSAAPQNLPVKLQSLGNIVDISAFGSHALALSVNGTVYAWGNNAYGELGDGTTVMSRTPKQVVGLPSDIVKIAAGGSHSLALTGGGDVYAWGNDADGQASGQPSQSGMLLAPAQVDFNGETIRSIAAGESFSLALTITGAVYAWGADKAGQTRGSSPTSAIAGLTGVQDIQAGQYYALALTVGGAVYAWGDNTYGQLGNGSNLTDGALVTVASSNIAAIYAGETNGFAVKKNGTLWAWGNNMAGQMGLYVGYGPDKSNKFALTAIHPSMTNVAVTGVASGAGHTLVLLTDGTVMAAGLGMDGQLGAASAPFDAPGYFTPVMLPYASLSSLQLYEQASGGVWTPHYPLLSLRPDTFGYPVTITGSSLCVSAASSNGAVTIAGATRIINYPYCDQVPIAVGQTTVDIVVRSYLDASIVQTYSLNVTRPPSSSDTTPPTLVGAAANSGVAQVTLTFDEPLASGSVLVAGFSVKVGGTTVVPVQAATLDASGRSLTLTLRDPLPYNQAVALDIAPGAVKDAALNPSAGYSGFAVSLPSLEETIDAAHDGVHIDDIAQFVLEQHDVTGDGKFDGADVLLLLNLVQPVNGR